MVVKTVTIKAVSKFGGILIEGEEGWKNPDKSCKDRVSIDLKGKTLALDFNDKGYFKFADQAGEPAQVTEERIVSAPVQSLKEEFVKGNQTFTKSPETQRLIVRQSSLSQAQTFITNTLKAVELGLIAKEKIDENDLTQEAVMNLAHKFEEDVMR